MITNYCKKAEQKASVGLAILSFLIPVAGLIIFLVCRKERPKTAKASGICAITGALLGIIGSIIFTVFGNTLESFNKQEENNSFEVLDDIAQGSALENFDCTVKNTEITTDGNGADIIIVTYEFTNNSDTATSFDYALRTIAYQDGAQLEPAINVDNNLIYDAEEINPDKTKIVEKAYLLNDTTTTVDIEISELFLSESKTITTIELE